MAVERKGVEMLHLATGTVENYFLAVDRFLRLLRPPSFPSPVDNL